MRPSQRPLSFEQEFPKHEFAPLIALALKVATWAVKRRSGQPLESHGAGPRAFRVGQISPTTRSRHAKLTMTAAVVMFALAAAFSSVYADCPSEGIAGSLRAPPVDAGRASEMVPTAEILRRVIKSSKSDGLDVYNDDFRTTSQSFLSFVDRH